MSAMDQEKERHGICHDLKTTSAMRKRGEVAWNYVLPEGDRLEGCLNAKYTRTVGVVGGGL